MVVVIRIAESFRTADPSAPFVIVGSHSRHDRADIDG